MRQKIIVTVDMDNVFGRMGVDARVSLIKKLAREHLSADELTRIAIEVAEEPSEILDELNYCDITEYVQNNGGL